MRIKGVSAEQREHFIKLTLNKGKMPERQLRYSWPPGDIEKWGNSGMVHYSVASDLRNRKRLPQ